MSQLKVVSKFGNINRITAFHAQRRHGSSATDIEWAKAKPLEEMPGYTKWQFFRAFMPGGKLNGGDFIKIIKTIREEFGDLSLAPGLLGQPARVITFQPKDFEIIFRNDGSWPIRNAFEVLKEHRLHRQKDYFQGTVGILLSNGADWGKVRSAVNPVLMQPKTVKNYVGRIEKVTDEFIGKIKEIRDLHTLEMPDNFVREIHRWTLENISTVALDKQLGLIHGHGQDAAEANEFFEHINIFFEEFTNLEVRPPFWKYIETPTFKKVMKSLDYITNFVDKHIKASIARMEANEANKAQEVPDEDKGVLERLLKIDRKIAAVMAIDMFFAGVDTTTSTLTGILLCLSKSPDKQAKLREEILKVLPSKNSKLNAESMQNLPYLRACIKEALRLYPLGPGVIRCTSKDMVLSGYRIPKGTEISMINEFLMKDASFYPEPTKFLPERWLRQPDQATSTSTSLSTHKAANPFVYFPFSFGPRSCVGKRLAELELEIGVMKIIRNFTVAFPYSTENIFKNNLIYVPNKPLKFQFTDYA